MFDTPFMTTATVWVIVENKVLGVLQESTITLDLLGVKKQTTNKRQYSSLLLKELPLSKDLHISYLINFKVC